MDATSAFRLVRNLAVFAVCLLAAATHAETAASTPSLEEIVHRAVQRDDALRASRMGMKCEQTVKAERFDSTDKVVSTTTTHTVHAQTSQISYNTDLSSSNAKGSGEAVGRQQSDHVEANMNLGKLAGRFQMALDGEETVRGTNCYVVRYWPKGGQTSSTREEKVINNLKGRFWIAKDDYSILKSEGWLSSPVTVALIASVNRMDFHFMSQTLPNGDMAPGSFSVNIAVKAPFYDFREKKTTTQENWR